MSTYLIIPSWYLFPTRVKRHETQIPHESFLLKHFLMCRVQEFIKDLKALKEFYLFNLPQLDSSLNGLSGHSSLKTLRIHCHHLLQDENDYDFHSGIYEDSVELKSLSIERITEKGWVSLAESLFFFVRWLYITHVCQARLRRTSRLKRGMFEIGNQCKFNSCNSTKGFHFNINKAINNKLGLKFWLVTCRT